MIKKAPICCEDRPGLTWGRVWRIEGRRAGSWRIVRLCKCNVQCVIKVYKLACVEINKYLPYIAQHF